MCTVYTCVYIYVINWLQDCIDIKLLITINTSESDRICNHSNCSEHVILHFKKGFASGGDLEFCFQKWSFELHVNALKIVFNYSKSQMIEVLYHAIGKFYFISTCINYYNKHYECVAQAILVLYQHPLPSHDKLKQLSICLLNMWRDNIIQDIL